MFTTSLLLLSSFVQEAALGYVPSGTARRPTLYLSDLVLSTLTFLVAAHVLRFAMRTLIETTTLQTQPARVTKAVKWLTRIGLLGLFTVAIEFLLLLELRSDSKDELSISTSIYDWLIMFVQSGFLYWACRHERYQSVLMVLLFQLVSVAVTSFDLIAQQTDLVQMFIILLFHQDRAVAKLKDDVTHFPISHFVVFMVLHFLQIIQWFLMLIAMSIGLFIVDNLVRDDSAHTNDVHEITVIAARNGQHRAVGAMTFDNVLYQPDAEDAHVSIQNTSAVAAQYDGAGASAQAGVTHDREAGFTAKH